MSSRQPKKIKGLKPIKLGGIDKDEREEIQKRLIKYKLLNKKILSELSDLKFKYDFEKTKLEKKAKKEYIQSMYLKTVVVDLIAMQQNVEKNSKKVSKKVIEDIKQRVNRKEFGNITNLPNNLNDIIIFLKAKYYSYEKVLDLLADKLEKLDDIYKPKIKLLESKLKNIN